MTDNELNLTMSKAAMTRAEAILPGGVNSPVRALRGVGGTPFFAASGEGAWIKDIDGNRYVDLVLSWGPLILGHRHPAVVDAVRMALDLGFTYGAPTVGEVDLAEKIQDFFPMMNMLRLVNSGTEATMSAVRLARGFTNRPKLVKFEGCYHGHADYLLVKAGSGAETFGTPDSAGVPESFANHTITLPYNDPEALERVFALNGNEISAVIVELVVGNMGVILPSPEFVSALRTIPKRHGALLILDEVMSGFRVSRGGAQEYFEIDADLTCLGKVIGGGLPVGAYGGRPELMKKVSPLGPVYQAGTLSGNPLSVAAGMATLAELEKEGVYEGLESASDTLCDGLASAAQKAGVPVTIQRAGTMFTVFFTDQPVINNLNDVKATDTAKFAAFYHAMRRRGVSLPPSAFEAAFVSTAHDANVIDFVVSAAQDAFREIA